jgi:hypothetical protein
MGRSPRAIGAISQWLVILGTALVVSLGPRSARAEEIQNMIRYFDANGVAHYVTSLEQVPPEHRASAKAPDSTDVRMPPVTSIGNDRYGRQARALEYKHRREEREKQIEKLEQEYRSLQTQEAGPRAESAARKTVNEAVERERRLQERKEAIDARAADHATWLKSCERQERIVEHERARHWLAYGQRWSDEEAAARKRKAFAESRCQPLK